AQAKTAFGRMAIGHNEPAPGRATEAVNQKGESRPARLLVGQDRIAAGVIHKRCSVPSRRLHAPGQLGCRSSLSPCSAAISRFLPGGGPLWPRRLRSGVRDPYIPPESADSPPDRILTILSLRVAAAGGCGAG